MPGGIRGTRPEKPLVCHERDVRPGAWPAGVMEWHGCAGAGPRATPVRLANGRVGRMTPPGDAVQCLAELHARCIREPCHTRLQDRVCAYQDAYSSQSLSDPPPSHLGKRRAAATLKVVAHITACKSATRACPQQVQRAARAGEPRVLRGKRGEPSSQPAGHANARIGRPR